MKYLKLECDKVELEWKLWFTYIYILQERQTLTKINFTDKAPQTISLKLISMTYTHTNKHAYTNSPSENSNFNQKSN